MMTLRPFLPAFVILTACAESAAVDDVTCDAPRVAAVLPGVIREASGITLSASQPGLVWIHNDSEGSPAFYALDTRGTLRAEIPLPNAPAQFDWEDVATGPCPEGTCLYVADVGDNLHARNDRAILRLTEPRLDSVAGDVVRFPILYPAGPEDAEALFVLPDTTVYVITKGRRGPVTVYRYPPPLRANVVVTLEEVQQLTPGLVQGPDLVTGAAAHPNGRFVAVRSYARLHFYAVNNGHLAPLAPDSGFDLSPLHEPQGEAVTIADDGTILLASESGLDGRRAPMSTMKCTFPQ